MASQQQQQQQQRASMLQKFEPFGFVFDRSGSQHHHLSTCALDDDGNNNNNNNGDGDNGNSDDKFDPARSLPSNSNTSDAQPYCTRVGFCHEHVHFAGCYGFLGYIILSFPREELEPDGGSSDEIAAVIHQGSNGPVLLRLRRDQLLLDSTTALLPGSSNGNGVSSSSSSLSLTPSSLSAKKRANGNHRRNAVCVSLLQQATEKLNWMDFEPMAFVMAMEQINDLSLCHRLRDMDEEFQNETKLQFDVYVNADPNVKATVEQLLDCNRATSTKKKMEEFSKMTTEEVKSQKKTNFEKRRHIEKEIIETEKNFVQVLRTLKTCMDQLEEMIKRDSHPIISLEEWKSIFFGLPKVLEINEALLKGLQETEHAMEEGNDSDLHVGKILCQHAEKFEHYTVFINNSSEAQKTLKKCRERQPFRAMLQNIRTVLNKQDIDDLLIAPIQRVPRYILFLKEMINATNPSDALYHDLIDAKDKMEQAAQHINSEKETSDNSHKLFQLQNEIQDLPAIVLNAKRNFVGQLEASELDTNTGTSTGKHKIIYLFNDKIVIAKRKSQALAHLSKQHKSKFEHMRDLTDIRVCYFTHEKYGCLWIELRESQFNHKRLVLGSSAVNDMQAFYHRLQATMNENLNADGNGKWISSRKAISCTFNDMPVQFRIHYPSTDRNFVPVESTSQKTLAILFLSSQGLMQMPVWVANDACALVLVYVEPESITVSVKCKEKLPASGPDMSGLFKRQSNVQLTDLLVSKILTCHSVIQNSRMFHEKQQERYIFQLDQFMQYYISRTETVQKLKRLPSLSRQSSLRRAESGVRRKRRNSNESISSIASHSSMISLTTDASGELARSEDYRLIDILASAIETFTPQNETNLYEHVEQQANAEAAREVVGLARQEINCMMDPSQPFDFTGKESSPFAKIPACTGGFFGLVRSRAKLLPLDVSMILKVSESTNGAEMQDLFKDIINDLQRDDRDCLERVVHHLHWALKKSRPQSLVSAWTPVLTGINVAPSGSTSPSSGPSLADRIFLSIVQCFVPLEGNIQPLLADVTNTTSEQLSKRLKISSSPKKEKEKSTEKEKPEKPKDAQELTNEYVALLKEMEAVASMTPSQEVRRTNFKLKVQKNKLEREMKKLKCSVPSSSSASASLQV